MQNEREFVAIVTIKKLGNESAKDIKKDLYNMMIDSYGYPQDFVINGVQEFEREKVPRGYKYNLIESA